MILLVSKVFAWILFAASVACFIVQFTTQQLGVAVEQAHAECLRPIPTTQAWQFADISDAADEY